jgi:hypothetical protein
MFCCGDIPILEIAEVPASPIGKKPVAESCIEGGPCAPNATAAVGVRGGPPTAFARVSA